MKNIEKLALDFVDEIKKEGTFASVEQVKDVVLKTSDILVANKDKSEEEILDVLLEDVVNTLEDIRSNYPLPGYTVGLSTGRTNIKLLGGYMNDKGDEMKSDAMFDIASMTKFYTQVIAYNLIKEKAFKLDTPICEIAPKYFRLSNLTVADITSFNAEFKTPMRIEDASNRKMAKAILEHAEVVNTGKYNYNDIGMMILADVMEDYTNMTYDELVNKYITSKLQLKDTNIIIPEDKISRLTGTPNASLGLVNDPKAVIISDTGSGHASIFASSDDLVKLGRSVFTTDLLEEEAKKDTYTPGVKANRGVMGNTYVAHPMGIEGSCVSILDPIKSFAIQGSTRVQLNAGYDFATTILMNPGSMDLLKASYELNKINLTREKPLTAIKNYDNEVGRYNLLDSRSLLPLGATMDKAVVAVSKANLQLRFINKVVENYDVNESVKEVSYTKRLK